ncbi:PAS domain-containing protein [Variovorax sp. PvP013]
MALCQRAIDTGEPDTLPLMRFDIPRPQELGGGFEKRYWSMSQIPVLDEHGEVEFVLHHPIDVTDLERLKEAGTGNADLAWKPEQTGIFERAQAVQESNLALKAESDRLRGLFLQAPSFMAVLSGPEHRFELANQAYTRLTGTRTLAGRTIREVFNTQEGGSFFDHLDQVYASGEPFVGCDEQTS